MDTTLAINPGSSSKKYSLFHGETPIFSALYEHTEGGFGKCVELNNVRQRCEGMSSTAYNRGLEEMIKNATDAGVIAHTNDITRIVVRIVAPGSYFRTHRPIDARYEETLARVREAAPLHIPHIESEIQIAKELFPHVSLYGISDSAFHSTMPEYARLYSIPVTDRNELDVFRSGYHGLSVGHSLRTILKMNGFVPERMIVVHAGSGVSITALQNGKSIDTTMGFAPTSGLIMNTRGGDLDPAALLYIQKKKNFTGDEMEKYLAKECGIKGLVGTDDLRIALDRMSRGDIDAKIALNAYFYHMRKMIGAYIGILGGLDVLVLTGTAAERNPIVRNHITAGFSHVGMMLDTERNEHLSEQDGIISGDDATVTTYVVRANEMREMAILAQSL